MLWLFAGALALAALCGVSILAITAADMLRRRRGRSLRPLRAFDLAVGTALALPSLIELQALRDQLL